MDLTLTADQESLQGELRRVLADRCTSERRRAVIGLPGAVDRDLWEQLAGLGVFALCLPETDGGVGLGLADAAVVFEELGRAAVPGPLVATFLAAGLVEGAADGSAVVGMVERGAPRAVEHLDALDALVVVGEALGVVTDLPMAPAAARPLDPLTPVTFLSAGLSGESPRAGNVRSGNTVLSGAE